MIVFYASRTHFVDHLLPIYQQFNADEVCFTVSPSIEEYTRSKGVQLVSATRVSGQTYPPAGGQAAIACATSDAMTCYKSNPRRKLILMEHGVGITFPKNQSYAGNGGIRQRVGLTLAPNEWIANKTKQAIPNAKQVIIGTPLMDRWANFSLSTSTKSAVCISFHWNGSAIATEAGTALEHYERGLGDLQKNLKNISLWGHGHPRIMERLIPIYNKHGIHIVDDFDDVLRYCCAYINDCSSTLYEAATLMEVVILNAPWFRRDIDYGIRFWKWTDIGSHCEQPSELPKLIEETVKHPFQHYAERMQMRNELYPYWSGASKRAAEAIKEFVYNGKVIS